MKTLSHSFACVAAFGLLTGQLTTARAAGVEPGFKSLFNGKDLSGWEGRPEHWSVQDGAITGRTTKEQPAKGNNFLFWRPNGTNGVVSDFELRLSYRIVPNNDKGFANSGIQYRSKDKGNFVAAGYQGDFEAGTTYSGILYDESGGAGGRNIMAGRGEKVVWDDQCKKQVVGSVGKSDEIQAKIKKEDWNDYVILAQDNHLIHKINGVTTVDVTDNCDKRLNAGILALQLHQGDPMTVQFKNIRIKPLFGTATAKSDLDQLQGTWAPVELVVNGQKSPAEELAKIKVKIKGNEYYVESGDEPDQGTFKVVESTNPKAMDVTSKNGDQLLAIYELSPDTFKACYAVNGAARPTEFKSAEGSDHVFAIYKRKSE